MSKLLLGLAVFVLVCIVCGHFQRKTPGGREAIDWERSFGDLKPRFKWRISPKPPEA